MTLLNSNIIELCLYKSENGKPLFLLLHRTKDEEVYPDIWQFITGSIESGEKAVDAALRELQEETGLKPDAFWVVPYVMSFYNADWDSINLSPFFAAEVNNGDSILLSDEHDQFGWFSFEEASRKLLWPSWKEGIRIVNDFIVTGGSSSSMERIF